MNYNKDMIESVIMYALLFVGIPYKWAGDNPIEGFDCSGFVLESLRAGLDVNISDRNAQSIYNTFNTSNMCNKVERGSLLFFGKSKDKITHIAIAIDNNTMIEAGGGGSKTLTVEDAKKNNAFVRIRPISNRRDLVAALQPNI